MGWHQVTWDLGLGTLCEPAISSVRSFYGMLARNSRVVAIMDHEVYHVKDIFPWSHFIITLPWSDLWQNTHLKPLGPWLGVNQTWTKRSDHSPKNGRVSFLIYIKKGNFGNILHVWSSPLLLPLFPCNYGKVFDFSLPWSPDFWERTFFCLSHCKNPWTMTMDNVGLKIGLLETSSSKVTLTKKFSM